VKRTSPAARAEMRRRVVHYRRSGMNVKDAIYRASRELRKMGYRVK
jgi:hypothetical protein